MIPEATGHQLMELADMKDTDALLTAIVAGLEEWDELLDLNVDLNEYRSHCVKSDHKTMGTPAKPPGAHLSLTWHRLIASMER